MGKIFINIVSKRLRHFCELVQIQDRSVISSVPGKSTHSELPWLSPFIEWEKI